MITWKLLYYSYALLHLIMLPQSWWIILFACLSMHLVTEILMSIVFQIAHIKSGNECPIPDSKDMMLWDKYGHQFATNTNFSPIENFYCGKLRY